MDGNALVSFALVLWLFEQLFLLISSVSTIQSQICVRNVFTCHNGAGRPVVFVNATPKSRENICKKMSSKKKRIDIVPRNGQSKGGGKLSLRYSVVGTTNEFFRLIIFVNQFTYYETISDLWEEYSICRTSAGGPVLTRKSDPLFVPVK